MRLGGSSGMADPIRIRPAVPGDRDRVRELMKVSLGEGVIPRTDAFWCWKHERNPFGESPVLVAEAEGQLVGLRAFMRWTWWSDGGSVSAVRAVDTATHPDWQGKGIFKRLTTSLRDAVKEEGVGLVYNTPNTQSRPGYLKMGWVTVGRPTIWVRPRRPARLLRAIAVGRSGGSEGPPPPVDAPSAADVLARPTVRQWIDRAADAPESRLHTRRTAGYLEWRYAAIPDFRYAALTSGDGEAGAIVLLRSRKRGTLSELRICDVVAGASPDARQNAVKLLRQASRTADADLAIAMPGSAPDAWLALAGYLPVPKAGPTVTVCPLNEAPAAPDPRFSGSWRLSIGDLELF